jgi:tRNA-splicing ligase RtcB
MIRIKEENSSVIKAWTDHIEDSALTQLKNLSRLPFLHKNGIAVMPDVHAGIGATVGSVIAAHKAIIPAAVGVDIGCGMNAVRLSLKAVDLPDSLKALRDEIEAAVPVGFSAHGKDHVVEGNWSERVELYKQWQSLFAEFPEIKAKTTSVENQLGTLGGGNHFIEICIDESQNVWIMLHSGSRGTGNAIGRYFIEKAKEECERWHIQLPDNDLAYLPEGSKTFADYVKAVEWAQAYALENRAVMMDLVLKALRKTLAKPFEITQEAINCHHNYVARESHFGQNLWVTRKGAIRAREGDLGIIPGSMGQRSYIVRGKGNLESYCSCSHGAGRVMSRTEARKRFSLADLVEQTAGVECRKDEEVIDEIPGAYKSIDQVMANQTDLVEVVHTLKQVLCVKG